MQRISLHYLTSAVILSSYGVQVCHFLESLTWGQLVTPILVAFGLQFGLQRGLWPLVEAAPFEIQSRRVFALVMGLFLLSGVGLSLFNLWFYQFPLGSGAKLIVGLVGLGLFCAVDASLAQERSLHLRFAATGEGLNPEENFFSQPKKLALLALALAVCMAGVFFLLIVKDLDWMIEVGSKIPLKEAQRAILAEVTFVVLVALGHFFNLIRSYGRNLQLFFQHENQALSGAGAGEFDWRVPVASADEFGRIAQRTNQMILQLHRRTQEVALTQDATIVALASLAETRDNETGAHIRRTQEYVKAVALHLQNHPDFSAMLTPEAIELMYKSAPLHDIGKVGIPDAILQKPGRLDEPEFKIMMSHARLGEQALEEPLAQLGESGFLRYAQEIAASHHEKWDGTGYPKRLQGDAIPLSGRIMAVADVYDALISKRVYKPGFPHETAMEIIRQGSGSHFDPRIVEAFVAMEAEILRIALEKADEHTFGK